MRMTTSVDSIVFQIMDMMAGAGQGLGDAQLASFIEQENQKQRFQTVVHTLTEQCWEICAPSISSRLDGKSETCLNNCVERFIDSSNYIINKLGQEGSAAMNSNEFGASEFASEGESKSSGKFW